MSLRCDECGAVVTDPDARFCGYCGAALPQPEVPPSSHAAERADVQRRFAALRDHPEARAAMRERPSGAGAVASSGFAMVIAFCFVGISGFVALNIIGSGMLSQPGGGFFGLFSLVPLVIVGAGIFAAARAVSKTARVASSPVEAGLAHVLDEHAEVRGSGDSSTSVHVVMLEDPDGTRTSHEVPRSLARTITEGDMGVSHTKGGELIRFTRIDV